MTWQPAPSMHKILTNPWVKALVAALCALAGVALLGLWAYGQANPPYRPPSVPEQVLLVPCDKPLMTPQEQAWALESGIGTYTWAGITVVDEGLPAEYWQPEWHE